MITSHNVIALWESGQVVRFHTCPTNGPRQTIADHAWGVAIFASYINPEISMIAILHALTHDCAEKYLGDVPAHGKWNNPEFAEAYSKAERRIEDNLGIHVDLDEGDRIVIKLADMLELTAHSVMQARMGNEYHGEVVDRCREWFSRNERMFALYPLAGQLRAKILVNYRRKHEY